jgi:hypothetical protein
VGGNLREGDHLIDPSVDKRIILKLRLAECKEVKVGVMHRGWL